MSFFSTILRQLFSKERRNSLISNSSSQEKAKNTQVVESNSSISKNNTSTSSQLSSYIVTSSGQLTSSKEGHSFKYEDGRRYHADEEVAYVLPNDNDGK
jgi:hypothetical protein